MTVNNQVGRRESRVGDPEVSRLYVELQSLIKQGRLSELVRLMTPDQRGAISTALGSDAIESGSDVDFTTEHGA
jgi:hypothetical protein